MQATIECGFTLKRVHDKTRIYSQMHRTDKYSQHSSLARWFSVLVRTKWLWVRVQLQSLKLSPLFEKLNQRFQMLKFSDNLQ